MTSLWLSRAQLRRDAQVAALAPLLLPEDDAGRALAAHRLVWSLMSLGPEARRDFLWREEAPGRFLLLSHRPAESSALFEAEAKPFMPELAAGDRLRFVLRANATIARRTPGERGRRDDVVMHALHPVAQGQRAASRPELIHEAGSAWLARAGAGSGFEPGEVRVDGYRVLRIPRTGAPAITLSTLEFEGILRLTDPAVFVVSLGRGFGRARAFGCGLMLIRRA